MWSDKKVMERTRQQNQRKLGWVSNTPNAWLNSIKFAVRNLKLYHYLSLVFLIFFLSLFPRHSSFAFMRTSFGV